MWWVLEAGVTGERRPQAGRGRREKPESGGGDGKEADVAKNAEEKPRRRRRPEQVFSGSLSSPFEKMPSLGCRRRSDPAPGLSLASQPYASLIANPSSS